MRVLEDGIFNVLCDDCEVEVLGPYWDSPPWQYYMVHHEVWAEAGMDQEDLCIPCLEFRLGRVLSGTDLLDCPINSPWSSAGDETERVVRLKLDFAMQKRAKAGLA